MTLWQPGMRITATRLMDGLDPTITTTGLVAASGFTVVDFTGKREGHTVTVDMTLSRNAGAGTIPQSAADTGNIASDPSLATLPSGWWPDNVVIGIWSSGAVAGDVTLGTTGFVTLRTITGSTGITEGAVVRVSASWIVD